MLFLSETLMLASPLPCRSHEPVAVGGGFQQLPNMTFLDRLSNPQRGTSGEQPFICWPLLVWLPVSGWSPGCIWLNLALVPSWDPAALGREWGFLASSSNICSVKLLSISPLDVLMAPASLKGWSNQWQPLLSDRCGFPQWLTSHGWRPKNSRSKECLSWVCHLAWEYMA